MAKLIGTDPNQVPTNADLGDMAYQNGRNMAKIKAQQIEVESGSTQSNLYLRTNDATHYDWRFTNEGNVNRLRLHGAKTGLSSVFPLYVNGDAGGTITMPEQPAFHAGLSTNTSSLTSGSVVVFNSVYENVGNHYNTSTGLFTAPVTGFYSFTTRLLHQGVSNGFAVDSMMAKNNSGSSGNNFLMQRHKYQADYTGHTGYLSEGTSGMIYLAAGDNFRVRYGGAQNSVIHGNPAWSYFCGHLVG